MPILEAWMQQENCFTSSNTSTAANYQPWLRLDETQVSPFATIVTLMPPELQTTVFSGDINIIGPLTLFPSPSGELNLLASGDINGLQPTGVSSQIVNGQTLTTWTSAQINLSDANPDTVPSVADPFAYESLVGNTTVLLNQTANLFLSFIDNLFAETGSTGASGALQKNRRCTHPACFISIIPIQSISMRRRGIFRA